MTPKVNFANLVCGLLPWHKRQPRRLALLGAFVAPLTEGFNAFGKWRDNIRMVAGVTSQVGVFEGYLRKKYNAPVSIKIVTYDDGAVNIALEREGDTLSIDMGLLDEQTGEMFVLDGEMQQQFGDAQFIVYIPADVTVEEIRADIERFRTAGTSYSIVAGYFITDNAGRRFVSDDGEFITIIQKI